MASCRDCPCDSASCCNSQQEAKSHGESLQEAIYQAQQYPVWPHTFVSPSAFSRRAVVNYWRKYVHEVLVNRLGGLSLPRKSVVRLTDRSDMTLDVYRGRKTTNQQQPSTTVSAGSKRSRTVLAEAKYDGQSHLYPVTLI